MSMYSTRSEKCHIVAVLAASAAGDVSAVSLSEKLLWVCGVTGHL